MSIDRIQEMKAVDAEVMLRLCDLPVFIQHNSGQTSELIQAFARMVVGDINWSTAILDALESDRIAAFEIAASASPDDIEPSLHAELDGAYLSIERELRETREQISAVLGDLPSEASWALLEAENLKSSLLGAIAPATRPCSAMEVEALRRVVGDVNLALGEARELAEMAQLEITEATAEIYDIADQAWARLMKLARAKSGRVSEHHSGLLAAVPRLLRGRKLEELRGIADVETDLSEIQISAEWLTSVPARESRRVGAGFGIVGKAKRGALSPYASANLLGAEASATVVRSLGDLGDAIDRVEEVPRVRDRAKLLLGLAKSAADEDVRNALVGVGLLDLGESDLVDGRMQHARPVLLDALNSIAAVRSPETDERVPRAVGLLVVAWCWPVLRSAERDDGAVKAWLDEPTLAYQEVSRSGRLDLVANIWASHLHDSVSAEIFLEQVSAAIGDDLLLFRQCARAVLKAPSLRRNPLQSARRICRLLSSVSGATQVKALIERAASEIASLDERRPSTKRALVGIAKEIEEELKLLAIQEKSLAPVNEIAERLPDLLRGMANRPTSTGLEPSLRVKTLAPEIFPPNRLAEMWIPVAIANDINAGPARLLTAFLRFSGPEPRPEVLIEHLQVEDLDPGEEREIQFLVEMSGSLAQRSNSLSYRIELDVGGQRQAHNLESAVRPSTQRSRRADPYVAGPALREDDVFVGRERELEELRSSLVGDAPKRALLLHGIRRIGKTSLLHRLNRDPDILRGYGVSFWDVQDLMETNANGDVLFGLAQKILDTLPERFEGQIFLHRKEFRDDPFRHFEEFVASVDELSPRHRALLLIDEFDRLVGLTQSEKCSGITPDIMAAIRKAIMGSSFLHIVFCGLPILRHQEYRDRLFGLMHPVPVRPLQRAEVDEIIDRSKSLMTPTATARQRIHRMTGRQPYLVQALCSFLFHRMKNEGRGVVTLIDVDEVIAARMSTNTYTLDYLKLIAEADFELLRGMALAHMDAPNRDFVSTHEVLQALRADGVECTLDSVLEALTDLAIRGEAEEFERPLVSRAPNSHERFQLVIGLVGRSLAESS